jgi:membrane-associated phospholipid phosphatase
MTTSKTLRSSTLRARAPLLSTVGIGILLAFKCPFACAAQGSVLEDAGLYFTAPLRWDEKDWLYFGGSLLAIGAAHEYDANVRDHFATGARAVLDGKDRHSTRDAAPAAAVVAATFAFAALTRDPDGYSETWSMVEAGGFSAVSATLLKFAAGRRRPNETTQVDDWSNGGSSFPSLHVSAAFAIGTVLAESGGDDFRWIRRTLGYGVGLATAYARVHDNVHWLSDTVAGAALGVATAHFVMNRRYGNRREPAVMVVPVSGGLMLTYSASWH